MTPIPTLREDQQAIADHPARFKVVACGRRWGKTTLGLHMAIDAARKGGQVWWVSPNYGMAFHQWRTLKANLEEEWTLKLEKSYYIELPGGGSITVRSADNPDSLRGVGLDFVVVDEAAFMCEDAWMAALRPTLADRRGKALIISTPKGRNWFFHAYQRGCDVLDAAWYAWRAPTISNPIIDADEVADAEKSLAESVFRQEYLAEFIEDNGTVFRNVRAAATAPVDPAPQTNHRYLMGVDFGRYDDMTAAAVVDVTTGELVQVDRFNEVNWAVQRSRIAALAKRWNVEHIHAEANAMGEPNIEGLREMGLQVVAFLTTRTSKPYLIERLVSAIQLGDLHLLPDENLISELEGYTYKSTTMGTEYKAASGRHDDTVIALALAWYLATTPRLAFGIAEV